MSIFGCCCICLLLAVVTTSPIDSTADDDNSVDKRAMRNALVRFGRANGMRNAIVRFGKRGSNTVDDVDEESLDGGAKRTAGAQPFVRFGRSGGGGRVDHIYDILDTLRKLNQAGGGY